MWGDSESTSENTCSNQSPLHSRLICSETSASRSAITRKHMANANGYVIVNEKPSNQIGLNLYHVAIPTVRWRFTTFRSATYDKFQLSGGLSRKFDVFNNLGAQPVIPPNLYVNEH